jgi:hypothetical protein
MDTDEEGDLTTEDAELTERGKGSRGERGNRMTLKLQAPTSKLQRNTKIQKPNTNKPTTFK